jgi:hypothetical protein
MLGGSDEGFSSYHMYFHITCTTTEGGYTFEVSLSLLMALDMGTFGTLQKELGRDIESN